MTRDEEFELFERIIVDDGHVGEKQMESCLPFIEMGKSEGLALEQVCEVLAGDGFLPADSVEEILTKVRSEPSAPEPEPDQTEPEPEQTEPEPEPEPEPVAPEPPPAPEPTPPAVPPVTVQVQEGDTHLSALLRQARAQGASDLHISVGLAPAIRRDGQLESLDLPASSAEETHAWLKEILSEEETATFEKDLELDFAYTPTITERYRVNAFWDRHGAAASFRIVQDHIPTFEELGLPEAVKKLTDYRQGLALVTGPAGSGKSTTLAALVSLVNHDRKEHIITIEDPVEYIHQSAEALVNHRQVGENTNSFATALRAALREDPDVIMVGEMRDLETISMAISAAETGHLVFGTLHTRGATRTVDRILDVFPPKEQAQIRTMVSESLRGIISQQLIPRKDGNGRALAMEILMMTPAAANLIRDARTFQLRSTMQTGKKYGMKLMDDSLVELVESGTVEPREAFIRAENPQNLVKYMQG